MAKTTESLTLTLTVDGTDYEIREMSGSEGICQLFELELEIISTDSALLLSDLIGQPAVLSIAAGDSSSSCSGRRAPPSSFGPGGVQQKHHSTTPSSSTSGLSSQCHGRLKSKRCW